MRKGTFLGIVLLVVLTLGIAACGGGEDPTPAPTLTVAPTPTQPTDGGDMVDGDGATGEVVNIANRENPYLFDPDSLDFQVGKKYVLTFAAVTEFHTFTVDELGLNIEVLPGDQVEVEFTPTADQVGTFKLFCIPHQGAWHGGRSYRSIVPQSAHSQKLF